MRRSTRVTTQAAEENTSAHSEKGLLVVSTGNQFDGRHSEFGFDNPNFELLANSFGAWGRTLTGPGQLPDALEEAFRQPGPALLAVPVDYGENVKLIQRLENLNFSIWASLVAGALPARCHWHRAAGVMGSGSRVMRGCADVRDVLDGHGPALRAQELDENEVEERCRTRPASSGRCGCYRCAAPPR